MTATRSPSSWADAVNVLCVRLDSMGDVLMTGPAMRALKASAPERRITLLTSSSGEAAGRLIPEIDEVIVYDAPWVKVPAAAEASGPDLAMIDELRSREFDGAVIFTVYSQNPLPAALLCHLADIPLRLAHCHENPYRLLTDWLPDLEPSRFTRHEVRRQLDLVAHIGCSTDDESLSMRVGPAARCLVRAWLSGIGLDTARPWVVVHPGASAPSRRYPAEHFSQVVRDLVGDVGLQVVLAGDDSERALVQCIADAARVMTYSAAGLFDVEQLAALIDLAPILISNNTGPVHIAAAVGTPVVDLYALTNPQHTPWMVPSRVLSYDVPCRNCYKSVCPEGHHHCLVLVPPSDVVGAAAELLEETRERSGDFCRGLSPAPSI